MATPTPGQLPLLIVAVNIPPPPPQLPAHGEVIAQYPLGRHLHGEENPILAAFARTEMFSYD